MWINSYTIIEAIPPVTSSIEILSPIHIVKGLPIADAYFISTLTLDFKYLCVIKQTTFAELLIPCSRNKK